MSNPMWWNNPFSNIWNWKSFRYYKLDISLKSPEYKNPLNDLLLFGLSLSMMKDILDGGKCDEQSNWEEPKI